MNIKMKNITSITIHEKNKALKYKQSWHSIS